jgi:hypothetical protein
MNNNTVPYVYLVGWTDLDKYYIGVKHKKGSHPRDFWVKYFTSSKIVPKFRKEHGEPDVIMIIREHETAKDAVEHEDKLLRRLHAVKSDRFLNRARSGVEWNSGGYTLSAETKSKMSKAQTGRVVPYETRAKLSKLNTGKVVLDEIKAQISKSLTGRARSAEVKAKISKSLTGRIFSDETKTKISKANTGRTHSAETKAKMSARILSDETKAKISLALKGVPIGPHPLVTCPYCGKVGGARAMKRWHFANCKQKPVE